MRRLSTDPSAIVVVTTDRIVTPLLPHVAIAIVSSHRGRASVLPHEDVLPDEPVLHFRAEGHSRLGWDLLRVDSLCTPASQSGVLAQQTV